MDNTITTTRQPMPAEPPAPMPVADLSGAMLTAALAGGTLGAAYNHRWEILIWLAGG